MYRRVLLAIAALVVLAGCATAPVQPQASADASIGAAPQGSGGASLTETAAAASESPSPYGRTTVTGRIVATDGTPFTNTLIRLAEVYRNEGSQEGAFALDEAQSPDAFTDDQGSFTIPNIDARDYVLIVGDVYGQYVVVPDDSGKPRVWSPTADDTLDMGEISIEFPPAPSPSS